MGDLTRDATKLPGLIKATAGGVHAPALGRVLAHELEAQAAIGTGYQHHRHKVSLTVHRPPMTRHNLQGTSRSDTGAACCASVGCSS